MKYKLITAIGVIESALASLLGGWDKSLQTLLLFMAVDWFTGAFFSRQSLAKVLNPRTGAWRAGQDLRGCAGKP